MKKKGGLIRKNANQGKSAKKEIKKKALLHDIEGKQTGEWHDLKAGKRQDRNN